jgi:hypothetical protein
LLEGFSTSIDKSSFEALRFDPAVSAWKSTGQVVVDAPH